MEIPSAEMLTPLLRVAGVRAVLLIDHDGLVLETAGQADEDWEQLAALIATSLNAATAVGAELSRGILRQYIAEYDDGKILATNCGPMCLAVTTSADAVVGRVRHDLRQFVESLDAE